jgi:hypothetical protein
MLLAESTRLLSVGLHSVLRLGEYPSGECLKSYQNEHLEKCQTQIILQSIVKMFLIPFHFSNTILLTHITIQFIFTDVKQILTVSYYSEG